MPPIGVGDLALGGPLGQLRWWRRLARSSGWRHDRIAPAQTGAVAAMVAHARRHVPIYADLPSVRSDAASLRDVLAALPCTERSTLQRARWEERLSGPVPSGSRRLQSTGSSGRPLEVVYPPGFTRWQGLLTMRADRAAGIGVRPRRLNLAPHRDARRGRRHLHELVWRRAVLSMEGTTRDELVAAVRDRHPDVIGGFPHLLAVVGREVGAVARRGVLTHGETVDDIVRAELAELFGHTPIDRYGTSEAAAVAFQCAAVDLYHLHHESVVVEVLDAEGRPVAPGDTGEVTLTSLTNPLMPVVRYRTEDLATVADRPCRCGYDAGAIERFEGRRMDSLRRTDGSVVLPHQLWILLQDGGELVAPVLNRYQVHQRTDGSVEVLLDLRAHPGDDALTRLTRSYERALGPGSVVRLRTVDQIEPGGAKFRLVRRDPDPPDAPA